MTQGKTGEPSAGALRAAETIIKDGHEFFDVLPNEQLSREYLADIIDQESGLAEAREALQWVRIALQANHYNPTEAQMRARIEHADDIACLALNRIERNDDES